MIGIFCVVKKQRRRRSNIENYHINVAIVVYVAKSHATARLYGAIVQSCGTCDLAKCSIPLYAIQQKRFAIFSVAGNGVDIRIYMAAGDLCRIGDIGESSLALIQI